MYELTGHYQIEQKIKEEGDYKGFVYRHVVCEINVSKVWGIYADTRT